MSTNEDIKTIQECNETMLRLIAQMPTRMTMNDGGWSPVEVAHRFRGICDDVKSALDRLEVKQPTRTMDMDAIELTASLTAPQQSKRLTDEEIGRYVSREYERACDAELSFDGDALRRSLIDARGHGYLGGLTVDEVMEVVVRALDDHDNTNWQSPPISYNAERDKLLRARLTAKLQGK